MTDRPAASAKVCPPPVLCHPGGSLTAAFAEPVAHRTSTTEAAAAIAAPVARATIGLHFSHSQPVSTPAGTALIPTMKL